MNKSLTNSCFILGSRQKQLEPISPSRLSMRRAEKRRRDHVPATLDRRPFGKNEGTGAGARVLFFSDSLARVVRVYFLPSYPESRAPVLE